MEQERQNDQLWEIAKRFGVPEPMTLLGRSLPPFDIKRPNLHESKTEFLAELKAVKAAREHAIGLARLLSAPYRENAEEQDVAVPLCDAIDESARRAARSLELRHATDLVLKNAAETNLSFNASMVLLSVLNGLNERYERLKEQEPEFWKQNGRPPNHYARTIALRFAKLVARHTGQKPTVGVSRDGNHPSTEFGRAIEEIFSILEIDAAFRRHAEWAVDQLTDEDMKAPPANALMGGLFGLSGNSPAPSESLNRLAKMFSKDELMK
jgi:hypothetical protein